MGARAHAQRTLGSPRRAPATPPRWEAPLTPVLTGHVSSLLPYEPDTSRPSKPHRAARRPPRYLAAERLARSEDRARPRAPGP